MCYFCGSPNIYPVVEKRLFFFHKTIGWRCANEKCRMYRRLVPSASFGPDEGNR